MPWDVAGKIRVANPHVFTEVPDVWWFDASCIPCTGFPLVELDAGLALERVGQGVVDWADSVGWHHNIDIVEESEQRLIG